jgi:adenylate cyclase
MNYSPKADLEARIDLSREENFSLGDMVVCPSTREARSPRSCETVEPRVMQALVRLVRAQGAVVSRDELVRSCWAGRAVSEDAINRCMAKVRQLGANGAAFVIETIPRVGYRLQSADRSSGETAPGSVQRKVGICVLPFANMTNDPEQEYLAEGITADIITDLSRWQSLGVMSRHATLRFKHLSPDPQSVARELGIRFVVEGSVRRMGDRIRIMAQLVEAESGNQIWAERFDRPVEDFFELQDQVVQSIVGTLVGRVYMSEGARLRRRHPSSLAAYEMTLRANALPWDDPASAAEAKHAFQAAIELDPDYGLPHSYLAVMLKRDWEGSFRCPDESLEQALALGRRGVELADNESTGHAILGSIYLFLRSHDQALRHCERGMEINPANHWNQADFGELLSYIGRAEEGLERILNARRADPYLNTPWYWRTLGLAHFVLKHYEDALAAFERATVQSPPAALAMMAGCCAKLDQAENAGAFLQRCFSGAPKMSMALALTRFPFKHQSDRDHLIECLSLAGLRD